MNISPDLHATKRRAMLKEMRDKADRHYANEYQRQYAEEKQRRNAGSLFPAVCWLAGVILVAAIVMAVVRAAQ